jgi:alpha-tubulin suppressor-like RCC1 family protein
MHTIPRFCSYNIEINVISCGQSHSVFITSNNLIYSMGSNSNGQLGINDPYTQQKYSPILIEALLDKMPIETKCGDVHTLVLCKNGDAYSWGNNDYG